MRVFSLCGVKSSSPSARQRSRGSTPPRLWAAALPVVLAMSPAFGQVNGTFTNPAGGVWADGNNWSGGATPGAGGTASFVTLPLQPFNLLTTLDTPVSLGEVAFNSAFSYFINGAFVDLTLEGAATLRATSSGRDSSGGFVAGHVVQVPIAGTSGLNKVGPGTISLLGTNTYSGPTVISAGTLAIRTGDIALGTGNASADGLTINGGTLRVSTTALTSARPVTVGVAGAVIQTFSATTLNGAITGSGSLTKRISNANLTLTASNSYAGATRVFGGQIVLAGAGSILSSSQYVAAGAITLDNASVNVTDRLSDTATFTSLGGQFAVGGNSAEPSTERVGTINLLTGSSLFTLLPNAAQPLTVTAAALTRSNASGVYIRGTGLGAASGPNVARFILDIAPLGLVGAGGAAGSTTQSVLPWIAGNTLINTTNTQFGATFVTFDAAGTSLRPLAPAEHFGALAGSTASNNVRLLSGNASNIPTGGVSVNTFTSAGSGGVGTSLVLNGATGDVFTIAGGGILHAPLTATNSLTFNVPVDFGSAEGVVYNLAASSFVTFNRPISGSGGLTKLGNGSMSVGALVSSTYTGVTSINEGTVQINGDVLPNVPGPFGSSGTPIVLAPSSSTTAARILVNGVFRIDRDVSLIGNGTALATLGTTTPFLGTPPAVRLTVNGNVDMQRPLAVELPTVGTATFNGRLTGPGQLSASGSTAGLIVLNASNGYTGGTEFNAALFSAGDDTAFGPGPLIFTAGGGRISATAPRVLANEVLLAGVSVTTTQIPFTITGNQPIRFTGTIDLNGGNPTTGGAAWNIGVSNTALTTFAGPVINGGFSKSGAGTLVLTADNNYSGVTTISAGTLQLGDGGSTGSISGNITNNAALVFNRSTNVTHAGLISGTSAATSSITKLGAATLVLTADNGFVGLTTISAGTLQLGNGGATGSIAGNITNNAALVFNRSNDLTHPGLITGTGSITKLEAGTVTFSAGKTAPFAASFISIAAGAIDLTDNDFVLRSMTLTQVTSLVSTGQLFSSLAGDSSLTALAVFSNTTDSGVPFYSSYGGVTLTASDIVVKYTYVGDTNIDGLVDGTDLANAIEGYSTGQTGWSNGDTNYDGVVDATDISRLLNALTNQGGPLGSIPTAGGVIPEPTAVATLLPAALTLLGRRRRATR